MKIFGLDLCEYKYIFGRPREGAHAYRLFDIAVVDVAATVLLAFVIFSRIQSFILEIFSSRSSSSGLSPTALSV